jgi:CRP-like cAMP-binding protein
MFLFVAQLEQGLSDTLWTVSCVDFGEDTAEMELYICSAYYIMTTTATVGYGDITPKTTIERVFGMGLMFCGVLSFTFVSGTLASILSAFDTREALLSEKVMLLNKLKQHYVVPEELIQNIRSALNFDAIKHDDYLEELVRDLPSGIKMELMMLVFQTRFKNYSLFNELNHNVSGQSNRQFVTWVSSRLKPRLASPGQKLYSEFDEIDDFYFVTKGVTAFVRTRNHNMIIGVIDPLQILKMETKAKDFKVFDFFGCEDSVVNHLSLLLNLDKGKQAEIQKQGEAALNMRVFTTQALSQSEYLTLSCIDLDKMKKSF